MCVCVHRYYTLVSMVCVCVSVCPLKTKRLKLAIFLKILRSKVMASFAHFVGVRRSCRALQFILTATEAAIATQKPNGKLNTAC